MNRAGGFGQGVRGTWRYWAVQSMRSFCSLLLFVWLSMEARAAEKQEPCVRVAQYSDNKIARALLGNIREILSGVNLCTEFVRVPPNRTIRYFTDARIDLEPGRISAFGDKLKGTAVRIDAPISMVQRALLAAPSASLIKAPSDIRPETRIAIIDAILWQREFTRNHPATLVSRSEQQGIQLLQRGRADLLLTSQTSIDRNPAMQAFRRIELEPEPLYPFLHIKREGLAETIRDAFRAFTASGGIFYLREDEPE